MELRWWPLGLIALIAAIVTIAVAVLLPLPPVSRVLRPLANVRRLTGLPMYRRAARIRFWSLIATAVLLGLLFTSASVTSSRPVGFASATNNFESTHPEDIMVCVGQPVTDSSTAGLLRYFDGQIKTFDNQRIGLTSPTLRVVPLTRDYAYASTVFGKYAGLAATKRELDGKKTVTDADVAALNHAITDFSRPVDYIDYAQSMEDVLALCMAGFPSFEGKSTRRRSLVYLGYTGFRASQEQRPSLFSTQQVKDMATAAGIQVNGIARTDVVSANPRINDSLSSIVATTGGQFSVYNPAGTAGAEGTDPTLASILDRIRESPPQAVLPNGTLITQRTWDYPNQPLTVSILLAAVLCAALMVLRR